MRKFLHLTIGLTAIALTSQAQINKGTVLLGGNLSVGTSSSKYPGGLSHSQWNGFSIAPSIGLATSNNTVWGTNLSYSSGGTKYDEQEVSDYNGYGGSIFYRRYATLGKGFYLFGEANAGYAYNKHTERYSTNNSTTRTTRIDIASLTVHPGIAYTVHKNFHLEVAINNIATLSYSNQKATIVEDGITRASNSKGFSFSTNISNSTPFSVGFRFALGK